MWSRATLFCVSALACACDTSKKTSPASGEPVEPSAASVAVGQMAPEVELVLQDGERVKLSSLKGKHVVLYFYPMDDTPGCRAEAQGFRDHQPVLRAKNVVVYGVSLQGAESHQAFIDKEDLNFDLVVDTDGHVARAFDVPVRGQYAARQTVLIDAKGSIQRIWRDVSPAGHAEEVLAAIGD